MEWKADEFSESNRKVLGFHRWLGTTRYTVQPTSSQAHVQITPLSYLNVVLYLAYNLNSCIKIFYLFIVLVGGLGPVKFLDRIAALDYFLCGVMVLIGAVIWNRSLQGLWVYHNFFFKLLKLVNKFLCACLFFCFF